MSGVESASRVLLLLGSLNLGSVVLNFCFTLGVESSGPAELKKVTHRTSMNTSTKLRGLAFKNILN